MVAPTDNTQDVIVAVVAGVATFSVLMAIGGIVLVTVNTLYM